VTSPRNAVYPEMCARSRIPVSSRSNAAFFGGISLRPLIPSLREPEAACGQGKRPLGAPSDDSLVSFGEGVSARASEVSGARDGAWFRAEAQQWGPWPARSSRRRCCASTVLVASQPRRLPNTLRRLRAGGSTPVGRSFERLLVVVDPGPANTSTIAPMDESRRSDEVQRGWVRRRSVRGRSANPLLQRVCKCERTNSCHLIRQPECPPKVAQSKVLRPATLASSVWRRSRCAGGYCRRRSTAASGTG